MAKNGRKQNGASHTLTADRFEELLLQSLTHEKGGVLVYTAALECVQRPDLEEEWTRYLHQTEKHVRKLTAICKALDLDPEKKTPGCAIVEGLGRALVDAMKKAQHGGDEAAAQIVACECVTIAETKDHLDWELLSACVDHVEPAVRKVLKAAAEEVEDEEDEHLYHSRAWTRELWLGNLGLRAQLPPPEEKKDVRDGVKAAKVHSARMHGRRVA